MTNIYWAPVGAYDMDTGEEILRSTTNLWYSYKQMHLLKSVDWECEKWLSGRMDKEDVPCLYNGILLSH